MTLAEFLLARIAEDETIARAAVGASVWAAQTGRWSFEKVPDPYGGIELMFAVAENGAKTQVARLNEAWEKDERGVHIALHDPARVLAECVAKREIVELVTKWLNHSESLGGPVSGLLEALALPYADHKDYRDVQPLADRAQVTPSHAERSLR